MARTLGPLSAEFTEAERAKFTAPLVLVHGLWDDPKSWRRFMGFLSHRGWRCIAVGWTDDEQRSSLAARGDALGRALACLDEDAVVVGHDVGGLLAMQMGPRPRASVALAPLVPDAMAAITSAGTWFQRMRGSGREAGRKLVGHYPAGRHSEPAAVLDEVVELSERTSSAGETPRLMLAGADDAIAPPDAVRQLALSHGADVEVTQGGHAFHLEDGWEAAAGVVHRWLVRNLGEELLALYEEAWADRVEE